ncbi:vitamin K epoxide reductase family protein [Georgenia sunbinii]|uniref:vitamin K epoxide reductase family protein n=1 Tax=Georgenia sunbinii TaxID=3117728 RepID=UPI002F26472A
MSHQPPPANQSAAVEDELLPEERELAVLDRTRPTEHQLAGGSGRGLAWLLTIGGAIGLWASVMLVLSERALLADPNADLACDINPIVGCGSFILSPQAAALGIPNALLGTIAFAVVLASGLALLGGGRLPRPYWVALMAGSVLAGLSLGWFQYQALVELRGLCPYCVVVWVVTIPIVVNVLARGLQAGHLPAPDGLRRFVAQERALIIVAWYVIVVGLVVVAFWDQWALML